MLIFPIGLGSRLPSAPLMCLLLSVCIVGFSIYQFPVMDKFEDELTAQMSWVVEPAADFYEELCGLRLQDGELCKGIAKGIKARLAKQFKMKQDRKTAGNESATESPEEALEETTDSAVEADGEETSDILKRLAGATLRMSQLGEEYGAVMQNPLGTKDPRVRALPSFQKILSIYKDRRDKTAQLAKKLGILSGDNVSFITLLKAQFTHGGWLHLVSNLVVLVLIGIYVEARAGAVWFLAFFLVPGILGMMAHMGLSSDSSRVLIGASAGVAGVMGAFLVFFYRQPMKVWVSSFLIYNRVIFIPAYLILGLLFIVTDVVGAMSSGDGVAHLAHLGGLVTGFALGLAHRKTSPVAPGMLYSDEEFFTSKLPEIQNPARRLEIANQILRWNPNNTAALKTVITSWLQRPNPESHELAGALTSYIAIQMRQEREEALAAIQDVPREIPLATLITRVSLKSRLRLAELALKKGDWLTAVRLYDTALFKGVKPDTRQRILKSVEQLYNHVNPSGQTPEELKTMRLMSELKNRFAA